MHRGIEHEKTNIGYDPRPKEIYTPLEGKRITQAFEAKGERKMTSELNYQHPAKQEDDLLSPKTGTATSSPLEKTTSPIFQCCWEMKMQGYARPLSRQLVNDRETLLDIRTLKIQNK
jgi:hypothetical protein